MSSQIATTEKRLKSLLGFRCAAGVPLSSCPQGQSKVTNPSWNSLPLSSVPCGTYGNCSHLPEVTSPLRENSLHTTLRKEVRCRGWLEVVWAGKDLPHLSTLPAGALETGIGLFGGFKSSLYHNPGCS